MESTKVEDITAAVLEKVMAVKGPKDKPKAKEKAKAKGTKRKAENSDSSDPSSSDDEKDESDDDDDGDAPDAKDPLEVIKRILPTMTPEQRAAARGLLRSSA